jgi:hypothetical protein
MCPVYTELAEEVVILTHEELAPLTVFKTAYIIPIISLFTKGFDFTPE